MSNRNFREMLTSRQERVNSLLCVGLDPLVEKVPHFVWLKCQTVEDAFSTWMIEIVDATAEFASMFKPQRAHWEAIPNGERALRRVVQHIHLRYPDIPVFLDCKRGDIDRTQRQYREAHFTLDYADGMNYNGYMGKSTLSSLIDGNHTGRALVGLGRTSNPEAWEIQDRIVHDPYIPDLRIWELMVRKIHEWSKDFGVLENAGVVMGAAHKHPNDPGKIYSEHLASARKLVGNSLWFLIPGIGKQGGAIEETMKASYLGPGSIAINSSSEINFADDGYNFAEASGIVAKRTRDEINRFRA